MNRVLISLAVLVAPIAAHAATIAIVDRETTTTIDPGGTADFTASYYTYSNFIYLNSVAGNTAENLSVQPDALGINLYGLGTTTVTPLTAPDGSSSVPVAAKSPGGTGQGFFFGYHGADTGFLTPSIIGGDYALTFSGGGFGFADPGSTFVSSVKILGDYSSSALHTTATYDPNFNVVDNFTYSGGYTTFSVETTNYQQGSPSISFSLLGNPVGSVPEPGMWAMMIVGLGTAGLAMRRGQAGIGQVASAL